MSFLPVSYQHGTEWGYHRSHINALFIPLSRHMDNDPNIVLARKVACDAAAFHGYLAIALSELPFFPVGVFILLILLLLSEVL
jgi:hypothetical protein